MNYKDSDGYILIDMSIADISKSTQSIPGIYDRIVSVLDTNKLVLVINFGEYSPMPAIARKKLNYYVITTNLFIITINSNDIVIIEEAGESTVDVSIVPTYIEGTKIADYTIGEQEGAIYIPEVQSEINDNVTASNTTWSSDKISDELDLKADASSLASVATSGSYNDLTNKPVFADVAITGSYDDLIGKPTIPDELNDLSDVTLTSPTNGQTLVFDATEGKFINQTPPSGVTTLSGLSDVDITTPASGNILSFDGTNWTNETITAADIEYSSGVSVADVLDIQTNTSVSSASFTANSSNAANTVLSDDINLVKGLYLISIALPVMSVSTFSVQVVGTNITKYGSLYPKMREQTTMTFLLSVNGATDTICIKSAESTAVSFTYLDRGGLFAYRLA